MTVETKILQIPVGTQNASDAYTIFGNKRERDPAYTIPVRVNSKQIGTCKLLEPDIRTCHLYGEFDLPVSLPESQVTGIFANERGEINHLDLTLVVGSRTI